MRIVIAQMKHETNTFSPVPTPIERFAVGQPLPYVGREAYDAFKGTGSAIGAFIELAEAAGAEIVIPIAANAWPSGPVEDKAYEFMAGKITEAVAKGCDAILLDLHGAMVTESLEDAEGDLLARLRRIAPEVPIGVALDMHANVYAPTAALAQSVAGYQTYPHVDVYETGLRAARPIFDRLAGKRRPVTAWGSRPMLPHVMRQSSLDQPNKAIQDRAKEMEAKGEALAASFFVGFPHADIPGAGISATVVTDGDPAKAKALCEELLDMAWAAREDFVYRVEPLADSLARATRLNTQPVVLLDHYDNAASGGTMDTMDTIEGILKAGIENVAAFAVWDPWAVGEMIKAGIGATVSLPLGGKSDMPSIKKKGRPLTVTGRVKLLCDGRFRNRGPMAKGVLNDMGPTAVLDTGKVEIVVISRHIEPNDVACFHAVGIDPTAKRYLMLKSRVHWRAGFGDLARATVECAGTGVCTSNYDELTFKRVRRPIYPLDRDARP
ncbi:MAG: M81 family metallopeptidase [Alphaproteobacteria bacterium]|nr:M81 family metallopeptidase [Alphaproteobacteria bacterium]